MEHCDSCESLVHIDVDKFLYACSNYKLLVTSIAIVISHTLCIHTYTSTKSHMHSFVYTETPRGLVAGFGMPTQQLSTGWLLPGK